MDGGKGKQNVVTSRELLLVLCLAVLLAAIVMTYFRMERQADVTCNRLRKFYTFFPATNRNTAAALQISQMTYNTFLSPNLFNFHSHI